MSRIPFVLGAGTIALALLFAGGSARGWPGAARQASEPDKKEPKLRQLLKERVAVLRTIAELLSEYHKSGAGTADKVHEAELMVLHAELDLCDTDKERLAALEKIVKKTREYEDELEKLSKTAQIPRRATLKAKLERVSAEIALERFRVSVAPRGK